MYVPKKWVKFIWFFLCILCFSKDIYKNHSKNSNYMLVDIYVYLGMYDMMFIILMIVTKNVYNV